MRNRYILLFTLLIAGCSSNIKGEWSCPTPKGGKGSCVSINEADKANPSQINSIQQNQGFSENKEKIEIKIITPKLKDLEKIIGAAPKADIIKNPNRTRTEEKIGKIWFAAYLDSEGNKYSESFVYTVDEQPKWILK